MTTRKIIGIALAGALVASLSACNTVRGVAADLESAANAVDEET